MTLRIVSRSEWGATAPLGPPMRLPVSELWLHHSVTPVTADPFADMRTVERVGVQRFGRFSYSWAYHPSRLLLEGAGDTIGAHTLNHNSTALGLVLIGNYQDAPLTDEMVADLGEAIRFLIATNRLTPGTYPTGGHRDLKSTACPGTNAYARLADIRCAASLPTPHSPPPEDDMPQPSLCMDPRVPYLPWLLGADGVTRVPVTKTAAFNQLVSVYGQPSNWPADNPDLFDTYVDISNVNLDAEDLGAIKTAVKAALREGTG